MSPKWLKIRPQLPWKANRKPYLSFQIAVLVVMVVVVVVVVVVAAAAAAAAALVVQCQLSDRHGTLTAVQAAASTH